MMKVIEFTGKKVATRERIQEMHDRIEKVIDDYAGEIAVSTAAGVLEVLKFELIYGAVSDE